MQMYAIEMLNIRKEFSGIVANDDITLKINENEVHALLGENGAGKSTLMSVLFGLYQPDLGQIHVNGQKVEISNPNIANKLGIGMVHQHFKLIDTFTVVENIILGVEEIDKGMLNIKKAAEKITKLSKQYGLNIDPFAKVKDITVGMQQRVEILKMLYRDANILIFDEPTAVLTPQEIEELMDIILRLKGEGKTILIITHKLREIKAVAQRCTIIRLGKFIDTVDVSSVTEQQLAELMVGHSVNFSVEKTKANPQEVVVSVENLCVEAAGVELLKHVSLAVRAGEILGIAGVDGNGQQELIEAITGLVDAKGTISLLGENISRASIRKRTMKGISHIPADRHKHGLVLDFFVYENMAIQEYHMPKFSNGIVLNKKFMISNAQALTKKFDVRSGEGVLSITRSLSGGNQQKAIVARELSRNPKLLVAVQPTRGLDVGAIEFIHKQIIKARDNGAAVILVSYELDEILNLSDNIAVMYEGGIIEQLPVEKADTTTLGLLMAGVKNNIGGAQ
ncbi:MAG: ABC transporter ATP-binding protein [Culicoidibacterales bacterium]